MNIFEAAARKKLRFPSAKGELTAEQLFDLPLLVDTPTRADLDSVARVINSELKSIAEESFVEVKPDPRRGELELKLEIVKYVIATKAKEASDAKAAVDKAARRRRLLEALASKENESLANMSKEDLLKQLEEIDAG